VLFVRQTRLQVDGHDSHQSNIRRCYLQDRSFTKEYPGPEFHGISREVYNDLMGFKVPFGYFMQLGTTSLFLVFTSRSAAQGRCVLQLEFRLDNHVTGSDELL
jgi:hypothetical protein